MTARELLTLLDDLPNGIIADSRRPYIREDRDGPALALIERAFHEVATIKPAPPK